jgi:hypothetical protein
MSIPTVRVGDIGVTFIITVTSGGVVKDISSCTAKQITLRKPDGTTSITKDAEFSSHGEDGRMQYMTESASELDVPGRWSIQGHITFPEGTPDLRSKISQFLVEPKLD